MVRIVGVELSEAFDVALDIIEEGLLPLAPLPRHKYKTTNPGSTSPRWNRH